MFRIDHHSCHRVSAVDCEICACHVTTRIRSQENIDLWSLARAILMGRGQSILYLLPLAHTAHRSASQAPCDTTPFSTPAVVSQSLMFRQRVLAVA